MVLEEETGPSLVSSENKYPEEELERMEEPISCGPIFIFSSTKKLGRRNFFRKP